MLVGSWLPPFGQQPNSKSNLWLGHTCKQPTGACVHRINGRGTPGSSREREEWAGTRRCWHEPAASLGLSYPLSVPQFFSSVKEGSWTRLALRCLISLESVSRSVMFNAFATPWTVTCPWNSPGKNTRMVAISFSGGSFQPRDWTLVSLHCRWILCHLNHQESPINLKLGAKS